jgi:hypothetical protein
MSCNAIKSPYISVISQQTHRQAELADKVLAQRKEVYNGPKALNFAGGVAIHVQVKICDGNLAGELHLINPTPNSAKVEGVKYHERDKLFDNYRDRLGDCR